MTSTGQLYKTYRSGRAEFPIGVLEKAQENSEVRDCVGLGFTNLHVCFTSAFFKYQSDFTITITLFISLDGFLFTSRNIPGAPSRPLASNERVFYLALALATRTAYQSGRSAARSRSLPRRPHCARPCRAVCVDAGSEPRDSFLRQQHRVAAILSRWQRSLPLARGKPGRNTRCTLCTARFT